MLKIGSQVMYREGHKVKHKVEGIITYLKYENNKLSSVGIFLKNPKSTSSHDRFKFFYDDSKKLIIKGLPDNNNTFSVGTLLNTKYGKSIIVDSDDNNITLFLYKEPNSFKPFKDLKEYDKYFIDKNELELYKSEFKQYFNLNVDKINDIINNENLFKNIDDYYNEDLDNIEEDLILSNKQEQELQNLLDVIHSFEYIVSIELQHLKIYNFDMYQKIQNDEEYKYNYFESQFISIKYFENSNEDYEEEYEENSFYNLVTKQLLTKTNFSYKTSCLHLEKDQLVNYLVKE